MMAIEKSAKQCSRCFKRKKTKPNEYVIFSGHYDHLGMGSPQEGKAYGITDSIYNGAEVMQQQGQHCCDNIANSFKNEQQ
jgi:hypothetical protein